MRAPANLGAAGRAAWARAVKALAQADDPDLFWEAAERYARVCDEHAAAQKEWRSEGQPIVSYNPNGAAGVHPLLKAIESTRRQADAMAARLKLTPDAVKGKVGHPMGQGQSPDRRSDPGRIKLRAVK